MSLQARIAVVLVFGIALFIVGGYGAFVVEPEMDYEYTVKAEQVNDGDMVDGGASIEYDSLSEEEQEVLYDAFKKSDHFLGGAEARVVTDEPIAVSDEWRVVEIKGVPVLVAISGPVEQDDLGLVGVVSVVGFVGGAYLSMFALIKLVTEVTNV